jgi:hypothetical protein
MQATKGALGKNQVLALAYFCCVKESAFHDLNQHVPGLNKIQKFVSALVDGCKLLKNTQNADLLERPELEKG